MSTLLFIIQTFLQITLVPSLIVAVWFIGKDTFKEFIEIYKEISDDE